MARPAKKKDDIDDDSDDDNVAVKVEADEADEADDEKEERGDDDDAGVVVESKSEEGLRRKKRRRRGRGSPSPSPPPKKEPTTPRGGRNKSRAKEGKKKPEGAAVSSSSSAKKKKKSDDGGGGGKARAKETARAAAAAIESEEEPSPKKKKKKNETLAAARDANWRKRFEELRRFKTDHGHVNVTSRHDVPTLHRWVSYQRKQMDRRKNGESNHAMTDERRKALDGIGFRWSVEEGGGKDDDDKKSEAKRPMTKEETPTSKRDLNWKKKFEELKAFKAERGDLKVHTSSSPEHRSLYKWVCYQREQIRRKERGEPNNLNDDRLKLLEGLGFHFDGMKRGDDSNENAAGKEGKTKEEKEEAESSEEDEADMEKEAKEEEGDEGAASTDEEEGSSPKKKKAAVVRRRRPKEIDLIRWRERLEELRAFRSIHGHIRPRKETHTQLYNWVQQQRRQYLRLQRGKGFGMTPEKVEALEGLGFRWKTDKQQWDDRLEELRAYREVHGHCNVSGKTLTSDNPKLGKWVGNQRALYKLKNEGKPTSLTDERQRKLEELGIEWSRAPPRKKQRPRRKVVSTLTSVSPPPPATATTTTPAKKPDDHWPSSDAAKETETKTAPSAPPPPHPTTPKVQPMSPYVRRFDESADDFAPTWEEMFFSLVVYKARHGDCIIPSTYDGQPGLAQWVWQQRRLYKKKKDAEEKAANADGEGEVDQPETAIEHAAGGLTDDRVAALETIGFVWNAVDYKWSKNYEELVRYHKEHGHADVPKAKTGLGKWLSVQKDACRALSEGRELSSCGITRERVAKLEALGVTYERQRPKPTDWDVRFDELVEFYSRHGHTCVPQVYEENRPLGKWVTKQRYHYSLRQKGKPHQMYDNRLEALENLGFQWSAVGRRGNKSATRPEENYGLPQHSHEVEEEEQAQALEESMEMEEDGAAAAEGTERDARGEEGASDDRTGGGGGGGEPPRGVASYSSSAMAAAAAEATAGPNAAMYGPFSSSAATTATATDLAAAAMHNVAHRGGSFCPPTLPPMDQSLV